MKRKVKFIDGKFKGLTAIQTAYCEKHQLFLKYEFDDSKNNFTRRGLDDLLTHEEDYEICDNSAI